MNRNEVLGVGPRSSDLSTQEMSASMSRGLSFKTGRGDVTRCRGSGEDVLPRELGLDPSRPVQRIERARVDGLAELRPIQGWSRGSHSGRATRVGRLDPNRMLQVLEALRRPCVRLFGPRRHGFQAFGGAAMKVGNGLRDTFPGRPHPAFDQAFGDFSDGAVAHPSSGLRTQSPTVVLDLARVPVQLVGRLTEGVEVDFESAI